MKAYYNEIDPYCAQWLRNLINARLIAPGDVDERDIRDVGPDDLEGYGQAHFFAGIGGWSYAARLAGIPDDEPIWTGSCPCQPFSSAARGRIVADDLWPHWRPLVSARRPRAIFGEQVAPARDWFDGLCDDMEALDYEIGAAVLPACCIGEDHARSRIFFACYADGYRKPICPIDGQVAELYGSEGLARDMAQKDGISDSVAALSAYGNAIVPQVAAEFMKAFYECSERNNG